MTMIEQKTVDTQADVMRVVLDKVLEWLATGENMSITIKQENKIITVLRGKQ